MKLKAFFFLGYLIIGLVVGSGSTPAQSTDNVKIEKLRIKVRDLAADAKSRVVVTLNNDKKLRGRVGTVQQDSFTLVNPDTGASQAVAFTDVDKVNRQRKGLRARTWVIIGAVSAAVIIIAVKVLHPVLCDGGAGC